MPSDTPAARYLVDGAWTDTPPAPERILATLADRHPRLMLDEATLARVRATIAADPLAARVYDGVRASAEAVLSEPPSEYAIYDGRRLLAVSRTVKERVRNLAFTYLVDGARDGRYVERAWREVEAAIAFKDWNPSHFLDTAEMTHAIAIAYDWLYDAWSESKRSAMCAAIVRLGLEPGLSVYRGEQPHKWHENHNNWNQVCNGGLSIGALAIADREPAVAGLVLHEALKSVPRPMAHYAPDGGGTEGATYWDYGTRYNVLYLHALETALGTDFGLPEIDGFWQSGLYQMYMCGAGRMAFDFADCGLRALASPMHFWMGRRFGAPHYSWFRYSALQAGQPGSEMDLLWWDASGADYDPTRLPLDRHFRGAECASMRSAWGDPNALHVGLQAGLNSYMGHRHQDLGSIIVDALGERWIEDMGVEKESYQTHRNQRKRWEFYRIRAEGHNTLVLNPPADGPDQRIDAFAPIVAFEARPKSARAVVDLTDAYAEHATRVVRTVEMPGRESVRVTDEVEARAPADAWWFYHTRAEVTLAEGGRAAALRLSGKEMAARIVEGPEGAAFQVMPAEPLPGSPVATEQVLDPAVRKLGIHLPGLISGRLVVEFAPVWG